MQMKTQVDKGGMLDILTKLKLHLFFLIVSSYIFIKIKLNL